jgi:hypothetical protein
MDNAAIAWELPGGMRSAAWLVLVALAAWELGVASRVAKASEAQSALARVRVALSAEPPEREVARVALERVIAANDDPEAVVEAFALVGDIDENEGDFARALRDYQACVAAAPSSRWAQGASLRIAWLSARSEGDFAPLARVERLRRDPVSAGSAAQVAALARDADAFPAGTVRTEARMLVAEAWLGRFHVPEQAIGELHKVTGDPSTDPLTVRVAQRELVDALVIQGRLDEAMGEARSHSNELDPHFVTQIQRLVRRRTLRRVARGILVLMAVLVGAALARAGRRRGLREVVSALRGFMPVAFAFALYLGCVGGALASRYESGNAMPFLLLGAVVLPAVTAARAWSAVGSSRPTSRLGRALLCGTGVLAAAFVLLDAVNPTYLEGFGL